MNSAEWVKLLPYLESSGKNAYWVFCFFFFVFVNEIKFSKLFHCETNHCSSKTQWFFIRKSDYQRVMYT